MVAQRSYEEEETQLERPLLNPLWVALIEAADWTRAAFQSQPSCGSVVPVIWLCAFTNFATLHSLGITIYTGNGFKQNHLVL